MLFDIEKEIDERSYVLLLFALQASEGIVSVGEYLILASDTLGEIKRDDLLSLYYRRLIDLHVEPIRQIKAADDEIVRIRHTGIAVLINGAPIFFEKAVANYGIPEGTLACLIPLLDLGRVPAADRYVSTADNQELFTELAKELDVIKGELIRDQNAGELPFPVQEKRAMAVELEGLVGQIRAGYVRLSDLTQRARPLIKNIAETCKDLGVIAATISREKCLEITPVKRVIANTTYGTDVERWPIETPASFWTGVALAIFGLLLGPAFYWVRASSDK